MSADTEVPNPANPQDFNRYSYVGNNPISRIDPNGHAALCVLDSCAGGLSGGVSQTSCCGSMARAALTVGGTAAAGAAGGYVAAKALNATPQDEEANADGNSSEEDHKQPLPWNTSIDAKGKDKVRKQMGQRGWTPEEVQDTLDNPADTGTSMDTRRDPETGEKTDQGPVTYYYNKDGQYVVRRDDTGEIIQVSDKRAPDWIDTRTNKPIYPRGKPDDR